MKVRQLIVVLAIVGAVASLVAAVAAARSERTAKREEHDGGAAARDAARPRTNCPGTRRSSARGS